MGMTIVSGPEEGWIYRGIYKLNADTFTICRNFDPAKDQPLEFRTKPDSGLMLVVWKRGKPSSAVRPEAAP
jgi:hypothetical protein